MEVFAITTLLFALALSIKGDPVSNRLLGSDPSSINQEGACVVSLVYEKKFIGHGVLIKPDVVLTTASLVEGKRGNGFEVRGGSDYFFEGGQVLYPATIIVNREYDNVTKQNNLGLIFLCQPFTIADAQICTLPPGIIQGSDPTKEIPSNGTVFGWGSPLNEVADQAVFTRLRKIMLNPNLDSLDDNCKRYNTNEQVCLNSNLSKNICYRDLGNGYIKDHTVYCITSDSGPCYTNLEAPNNAICTSVSAHLEWIFKIYYTYANEPSRVCIPK